MSKTINEKSNYRNEPQLTPLEYTFQLSPERKCKVFLNANWIVRLSEDHKLIEENKLRNKL
jgi:hypothetical protein